MLSEMFYWIVNISIIGSLTGIFLLILRKIKALPRFAVYFLWFIPLLRFWIPFGIANEYSLLNLLSKFATKTVVVLKEVPLLPISPELTTTNFVQAAKGYYPIIYKTNALEKVFGIASVVWAITAITLILITLLLYLFTMIEYKGAVLIKNNIYKSVKIVTPTVYGVFHPKIILPANTEEYDTQYIVMHENVHIRRKDNLFRMVGIITACIHWFNPLSWILLKYFFADMELACDAKVLKKLDEIQKKEYAHVVLNSATRKTFFTSAFGGAKTGDRINSILSYKKLTLFSAMCFTALIIVITVILITNAVI